MIKILIADDHKIFRKGLRQTIEDNPGMTVVDEAENGHEVLSNIKRNTYDVLVLDISMPGPTTFDIIRQMKKDAPNTSILVLTMHPEDQYALRIYKAGAAGYITKETDEEDLIDAIRKISKGGKYVSYSMAEKLAFSIDDSSKKAPHEKLSDREYQVMLMIAKGKSISAIAREIKLGVSTVSTYRSRIMEKMHMTSNANLTQYAIKKKIIE